VELKAYMQTVRQLDLAISGLRLVKLSSRRNLKAVRSINYRCEGRRKVGELRDEIGAVRKVLIPASRKPG
jgi:hypothetical protein